MGTQFVFDVFTKYWSPAQQAKLAEAVNARLAEEGCVADSVNLASNTLPVRVTVTINNPSVAILLTHDDLFAKVNQLLGA